MNLSSYIDYTLLKATTTPEDIKRLCKDAIKHNFYSVCVNSYYVDLANIALLNSDVKVTSVIGFPLGAMSSNAKLFEAQQCIKDGADEIDMVMNMGIFKAGDYKVVQEEIRRIKRLIEQHRLKVIIETCYLTEEEIKTASQLVMDAGADFVKTSTGFGTGGATIDTVKLIKSVVKDAVAIKASGGIKNAEEAKQYIELGVSRIGTSSIIV